MCPSAAVKCDVCHAKIGVKTDGRVKNIMLHQLSNMELYFHQLQVWANNNDMIVNFNKTKEIVMGPPSKTSHLSPLHFSAGHFERANSVKLLGINLDADFS